MTLIQILNQSKYFFFPFPFFLLLDCKFDTHFARLILGKRKKIDPKTINFGFNFQILNQGFDYRLNRKIILEFSVWENCGGFGVVFLKQSIFLEISSSFSCFSLDSAIKLNIKEEVEKEKPKKNGKMWEILSRARSIFKTCWIFNETFDLFWTRFSFNQIIQSFLLNEN